MGGELAGRDPEADEPDIVDIRVGKESGEREGEGESEVGEEEGR